MQHFHDRAMMAHALTHDLEPRLHALLSERIAALGEDLIDCTEYLIVGPGDTEADIVRQIGLSPLVEPIEGARFGTPGFHPFWDLLADRDGWFEMIVSFGGAFACVLLIQDAAGVDPDLLCLCKELTSSRREA